MTNVATHAWWSVGLVFALTMAGAQPTAQQSINQRKTGVRATITGSPKLRDGAFTSTGVSGICGEIPKEASPSGTAAFVVEFPSDPVGGSITSVSFGSRQLVAGVAKTTSFRLNVSVVTANGGRPPGYVLNTDPPRAGNSGTATLSTSGGATTLSVIGQNEMNETIDITVECF